MTLASCNELNITKSERHVENAFQTREPSCKSYSDVGRVATELGFDYVLRAKSTIIKRAIGALTACRKCAQSETSLHCTRRRLRSQAKGLLRSSNVLRLHPTPHPKTLQR